MKKLLLTGAALAALALALASAPACAAQWDGGDDLPTNPLACGTGANAARPPNPMTAASRPARPTSPARRSPSSTCRS